MHLAAGLDFGGSSIKAWVARLDDGMTLARTDEAVPTARPRPFVAEFDPATWWHAAQLALRRATEVAGRPASEFVGVTVSSLRQGFVVLHAGLELGPGILNSDRRGARYLDTLRTQIGVESLYALTGHWPAPELTLPKLLWMRDHDAGRWAVTERVLFVHDWALWRLSGVQVTEVSLASSGQLAEVAHRRWATDLIDELGLGADRFAPLVEAGATVGHLTDGSLGLPVGLPVISGGGDTQFASLGAGGLRAGVATVVAGSTTPVQIAVASVPRDPLRHPWISTHLRPDLWAAETNAGYAGMNLDWLATATGTPVARLASLGWASEPGARGITAVVATPVWSEETWAVKPPNAVLGFTPGHTLADLCRAFLEAHAFAIRANLDDLERGIGARFGEVLLTGGAARDPAFCRLVADVSCRPITVPSVADPAAAAGTALVARAVGAAAAGPAAVSHRVEPHAPGAYDTALRRFLDAHAALRAELPEEDR